MIDYLRSLVDTMLRPTTSSSIEESEFDRTIVIDTLEVGTTEFDLSTERAMDLFESWPATKEFLAQDWSREELQHR
jgi:NTE family protein